VISSDTDLPKPVSIELLQVCSHNQADRKPSLTTLVNRGVFTSDLTEDVQLIGNLTAKLCKRTLFIGVSGSKLS